MTEVIQKVSINGEVYPFPGSVEVSAEDVSYDNSSSGATADNIQDAMDEVFQSVSNGKELIADAITDKGVSTSATDSFATMATNIESLTVGGKYSEGSVGDVLSYNYRGYGGSYINVCSSSEQTENGDSVYYYTCLFQSGGGETYGGVVVKYNNTTKKIYKTGLNITVISTANDQLKFFKDGNKVRLACVRTLTSQEILFGYFDETNTFTTASSGISERTDITSGSGYAQASRSDSGISSYSSLGTVTFVGTLSESINSYRTGTCFVV